MLNREISHLTPRYIVNRLGQIVDQKRNPDNPWLTKNATDFLDSYLLTTDVALEFGSGRSTLWFANRVGSLTSVEHDTQWYDKVLHEIAAAGVDNVRYVLSEPNPERLDGQSASDYVQAVHDFEDASLDFVLVDGKYRAECCLAALPKIKTGALLVIDDANRYLPSTSLSPNSRAPADGPSSEMWAQVYDVLAEWRELWTTDGVHDTALYFRSE